MYYTRKRFEKINTAKASEQKWSVSFDGSVSEQTMRTASHDSRGIVLSSRGNQQPHTQRTCMRFLGLLLVVQRTEAIAKAPNKSNRMEKVRL